MNIGERLAGIILAVTGALTLVVNDYYLLRFNSMENFSVSSGGLIQITALILILAGLVLIFLPRKRTR